MNAGRVMFCIAFLQAGAHAQDKSFQEGELTAPRFSASAFLGSSVDTDGRAMLSGAPNETVDEVPQAGAVYTAFYHRRPAPELSQSLAWAAGVFQLALPLERSSWEMNQRIVAPDPAPGAQFGASVAVDGDLAVIGAPLAPNDDGLRTGAVYVYSRQPGRYVFLQKLTAPDGKPLDVFGHAVDLRGEWMLIGALGRDHPDATNAGVAYVFRLENEQWVHHKTLQHDRPNQDAWFGHSVSLDEESAAIGAPGAHLQEFLRAGSVSVYATEGWAIKQTIQPFEPGGQQFGFSVSVSGRRLLVGSPTASWAGSPSQAGNASLYELPPGGGAWQEVETFADENPVSTALFGYSVAIEGDSIVVGSPRGGHPQLRTGVAYAYRLNQEQWWLGSIWLDPTPNQPQMLMGSAVSIGGGAIGVGARGREIEGVQNAGSAFGFWFSDCYADCDRSTGVGVIDKWDKHCYLIHTLHDYDRWGDCDGNGITNIVDFICFFNQFIEAQEEGCGT